MLVVRKRAGRSEDRLEIRLHEVLSDVEHEMGEAAALEKDGVERDLQEALAAQPRDARGGPAARAPRVADRVGPVDLMCRDEDGAWVAVEIKRVGTIDAVEQLTRYLERIRADPARAACRGILAAQQIKPQAATLAESRGITRRRGRPRPPARRARARADAVRADVDGQLTEGRTARYTWRLSGAIAQLGERLDRTQEVGGSNLTSSTSEKPAHAGFSSL